MPTIPTLFIILTMVSPPGEDTPPPMEASEIIANMQEQIDSLKVEVDTLKAQNGDQWLSEQRAQEIRGLVQDVLADADTRASLLQTGALAGYDKGFFLASADGNYKLQVYGQLQVRYVYNHRNDPPASSPDEYRQGFEIRRAKVGFKGHVFDPTWQYEIQLAGDRNTGTVTVENNAWFMKDFENGFKIKVGQMKGPYMLEELISSTRMLAVERSLFNSFFTIAAVQGVDFIYEADRWRVAAMYYDGARSVNTGWQVEDTEWGAVGGRAEFLVVGDTWKQFVDYDGWRGEETGVMVGVASNYQRGESGTTGPNDNEIGNFGLTADVTVKFNGFSIAGAFAYRNLEAQDGMTVPGSSNDSADQYGFYVQGGYFLTDDLELYARYEWTDADLTTVPDDLSVLTVGVSKFWNKHNLKWQTDVGYGFNAVNLVFAQSSAGWLPDSPGEDGQIVFRSQFQLLF
jgi:phosphate-selective porin OprO/OprP